MAGGNKLQVANVFFFLFLFSSNPGSSWRQLVLSELNFISNLELTNAFFLMEMSFLSHVNEFCLCLEICLSSRCMSVVLLWVGGDSPVPLLCQMHVGVRG